MGDYDAIELQGSERQSVIQAIQQQISAWGLTMPIVDPIPLHFGLNKFNEIGETEFWIANEIDAGYCGKFLFVFNQQTCPFHYHTKKHETFFVVKGSVRMKIDETTIIMNQGDRFTMPPGMGHSFTGLGSALLLEVSMPTQLNDNFFSDQKIGNQGVI